MLRSAADPLLELDQMGPSLGIRVDGVKGTRNGPEARRDGQDFADAPPAGAQTGREILRVEPTEFPWRSSATGFRLISFATDPCLDRCDRSAKEPSERRRGQAAEVAGALSRAGDGLEQEHSRRGYEGLRFDEESIARFTGKSEGIPEHRHHRKPPGSEGRIDPIASYKMGPRSEGEIHPEEHLSGEVESNSLGLRRTDIGQESSRSRSDVHDPSTRDEVSPEESDAEHAEQFSLRGTLEPVPLAVDPVRIERLEPFPARYLVGGHDAPSSVGPPAPVGAAVDVPSPRPSNASPLLPTTSALLEVDPLPYYECPKCGGGYVIDVPPSARPVCDRDGARLKRASDASYEKNARRD